MLFKENNYFMAYLEACQENDLHLAEHLKSKLRALGWQEVKSVEEYNRCYSSINGGNNDG